MTYLKCPRHCTDNLPQRWQTANDSSTFRPPSCRQVFVTPVRSNRFASVTFICSPFVLVTCNLMFTNQQISHRGRNDKCISIPHILTALAAAAIANKLISPSPEQDARPIPTVHPLRETNSADKSHPDDSETTIRPLSFDITVPNPTIAQQ